MLTIVVILALLATVGALGLGLFSMGMGGSADNTFGEKFMWARIALQGFAVLLILAVLYLSKA